MRQIKSWLPVFSGFYYSIWDYDYNMDKDEFTDIIKSVHAEKNEYSRITSVDLEDTHIQDILWEGFDYSMYKNLIGKKVCKAIEKRIPFVNGIRFEGVISPKYYNFTTDAINCEYQFTEEGYQHLVQYIYAHRKEIDEYLHSRYTSRDGFISYYPNNFDEWDLLTNQFQSLENDSHYLGAMLEYYSSEREITNEVLSYEVSVMEVVVECLDFEKVYKYFMDNYSDRVKIKFYNKNQLEMEFKFYSVFDWDSHRYLSSCINSSSKEECLRKYLEYRKEDLNLTDEDIKNMKEKDILTDMQLCNFQLIPHQEIYEDK